MIELHHLSLKKLLGISRQREILKVCGIPRRLLLPAARPDERVTFVWWQSCDFKGHKHLCSASFVFLSFTVRTRRESWNKNV